MANMLAVISIDICLFDQESTLTYAKLFPIQKKKKVMQSVNRSRNTQIIEREKSLDLKLVKIFKYCHGKYVRKIGELRMFSSKYFFEANTSIYTFL